MDTVSTRLAMAAWTAAGGFLRTLLRIARELFHEITGALFAVFAVAGAISAWREWQRGAAWTVAVAAGFALMMAWFAVTSFLRARRGH